MFNCPWVAEEEEMSLLYKILQKTFIPLKPNIQRKNKNLRKEVIEMKILRASKKYLDNELNTLFKYKSKRCKADSFFKFTLDYVKTYFNQGFLKLFNLKHHQVSDKLAVFIQPKMMQN